jgi:adenylate cyclase
MNKPDLQQVIGWLIDGARPASSPIRMLSETCERLGQAGVPLWRVGIFVRTLHPDIFGHSFVWRPGAEVVVNRADFDVLESPEFKTSPLAILYGKGQEVRYRLDDPESRGFPFFDDMRAEVLPIISRSRWSLPRDRFTHRAGPRNSGAASAMNSSTDCDRW